MKRDLMSELFEDGEDSVEVLTALTAALPAIAPSARARARLLDAVRAPALRWAPLFEKLAQLFELGEGALSALAERASLAGEWHHSPLPGVKLFHLEPGPSLAGAGADAGLVRVEAGLEFPLHRHLGEERTLILEGYASEDDGGVRGPGDSLTKPAGSQHSFTVHDDSPLIYAVVLFEGIDVGGHVFGVSSSTSAT